MVIAESRLMPHLAALWNVTCIKLTAANYSVLDRCKSVSVWISETDYPIKKCASKLYSRDTQSSV